MRVKPIWLSSPSNRHRSFTLSPYALYSFSSAFAMRPPRRAMPKRTFSFSNTIVPSSPCAAGANGPYNAATCSATCSELMLASCSACSCWAICSEINFASASCAWTTAMESCTRLRSASSSLEGRLKNENPIMITAINPKPIHVFLSIILNFVIFVIHLNIIFIYASPSHSLTLSLTPSLPHSFTHSFIRSLAHSFIRSRFSVTHKKAYKVTAFFLLMQVRNALFYIFICILVSD